MKGHQRGRAGVSRQLSTSEEEEGEGEAGQ